MSNILKNKKAIALVGYVHGHQHLLVTKLKRLARQANVELSLVLQVGDFEAHRDEADLASMAAYSPRAIGRRFLNIGITI